MLKTIGGAKHARILITLTAVCSLVLAMLAAGVSPVKADDPSETVTTKSVQDATPNKADLNGDLEGEISTQKQVVAGDDISVEVKKADDGDKVALWLFSTPTDLGTKSVEDGKVNVTIPGDTEPGSHTLAAYDQDGEQLGWTSLEVQSKKAAAKTQAATNDEVPGGATPMASSTSTDIVIKARTFSSPSGDLTNKANTDGASYKLYSDSSFNNPVSGAWNTCTVTGGTGECTINVPNTNSGGENYDKQYYVKQVATPDGTFANPTLTLGDSSLSTSSLFSWAVPGQTKKLRANQVQNLPFNSNDVPSDGNNVPSGKRQNSNQRGSYGAVPYSKDNPSLVAKCGQGLKIAMVLDLSGSTVGFKDQYKKAITGSGGFFDGLNGTGSSIASFTFGNKSPASGSSNFSDLKSIDTQRAALNTQLNNQINSISSSSYTNWESGLTAAQNAGQFDSYDYVLFVTDGAPNTVGNDSKPDGSNISVRALEAGIYAANAIKAKGKPVISVAVGNGVNKAEADVNLRAISGETQNQDYFKGDWDELNKILVKQAQEVTCGATVVATKEIPNGQGGWKADKDWNMTIGVQSSDSVTKTPATATQATNSDGQTGWNLQFTQPNATANVTLTETQKPTWEFKEGFCKVGDKTISVDSETATIPGVKRGDRVECTFRNAEIPSSWTLTKSSNPGSGATVTPGQVIEYTVTASNPSKAAVNNVVVNDDLAGVLASNADLVSGPTATQGTATITNNKLTWNVGTLAANSSKTVTYKVKVKSDALGKTIKNVVTGTGQVPPNPCPTDNPDCRTTEHFTPKWTLAKTSNPASGTKVTPGQKITYTLTATNSAGADVAGVVATDDLSAVLNNATLTGGPTTANGTASLVGNQLIWNVGTLAKNSIATVTYEVTINGDAAGVTINNSVSGQSNSVPPTDCKPAAPCTTTHTTDPTWTLAKTSDPASGTTVTPGQEITYTVTATNSSKRAISDVVVKDNLSQVLNNASFVPGSINPSTGNAVRSGNELTWTIPSLAAGSTQTVTYKVKVNDDAAGVTIGNSVSGNGEVPPTSCTTAQPCTTTHTTNPTWALAKTSNPATGSKVTPGQEITYTVTAKNTSKADIAGVVVNDDLSNVLSNATLVGSPNASKGSANVSGNNLKWTLGNLEAGKTETVTYKVKVNGDAFGVTINNTVSGNATTVPPTTCTEAQPCETTHNTDPTWSLAKTSNPASGSKVAPGQEITYTVTAKNPSKSPVTGVVVKDDLSGVLNNATLVGTPVTANGTAAVVANQLIWENVTLAPESESTVTYTVKVNTDAIGVKIDNVVTGNGDVPPTTCTEAKPCTTTHETEPAWTLAKTSNPASGSTVKPGDEITYTVTATNGSKGAVKNVVVNDNLSQVLNNATLIEGPTTSAGSANIVGNALTWNAGELAAGKSATVTYKVKVNDDALGVTIGNTVSGNSDTVPPLACTTAEPCTTTHETDPIWTLEKSSDPASGSTILPGSTINYTVTAKNPSKSAVKDVVVKDDLSNVLNNAALQGSPNASKGSANVVSNELTWTLGTIAAGATETVTYTVKVNADATGVTVGNVVTGDAEVPVQPCDEQKPDCRETEHFTPSYTLVKSSDPASGSKVEAGSDIKYTLTVNNNSDVDINDELVINDDLSDVLNNASFDDASINASTGTAARTGDNLKWTIPSLASGDTATVEYTVTLNADALGVTLKNVATGDADFPADPCPVEEGQQANNDCRTTTHETDPIWTLEKSSDPASGSTILPGSTINYTVTAKNPSKSAVKDVVVKDDLSNVLNNAAITAGPTASAGDADVVGNELTWTLGTIGAGKTETVTYTVKVNADATGVTVGNVVTGDAEVPVQPCPTEEGQEATNDCRETEHFTPSYTLVKSSDPESGSTVKAGDAIKYTLTVNNNSERDINDPLTITDDLSDVLNNSVLTEGPTTENGSADVEGDALTWTIPSLAKGETATVEYTVTLNEDAIGVTLKNVASGDSEFPVDPCPTEEGQEANNDCRETTHKTNPIWTMEKISDPASGSVVQPDGTIKYTVKAINKSKSAIKDVVVNDDLSQVLNHSVLTDGPTASTGEAKHEGNAIVWTIPSLDAGKTEEVTYTVKVNANAHGVVVNNSVFGTAPGQEEGEDALNPEKCTEEEPCTTTHNTPPLDTPTGPTDPAVTPTDNPSNPTDPAVTPTDGTNTDDQGVLPHTGAGLTVMFAILALILIGGGLVLRYASRQRKH